MITIDIVRVYDGYREELWRKLCYYFDVKQTMKRFLTNLTKIVAKCHRFELEYGRYILHTALDYT